MSRIEAKLVRTYGERQTLGEFTLFQGKEQIFTCKTLELPWKENRTDISCIPEGVYHVDHRHDKRSRFKYPHFIVQEVEGRSYILIHRGNYYYEIEGCILVGSGFKDINRDGLLDVEDSRITLDALTMLIPREGFTLSIERRT